MINLYIFVFSVYRSLMCSVLNNTHLYIRPIVNFYLLWQWIIALSGLLLTLLS